MSDGPILLLIGQLRVFRHTAATLAAHAGCDVIVDVHDDDDVE